MKTRFSAIICLILAAVLTCGVFTSCGKKKDKLDATEYLTKIIEASFAGAESYEPTATSAKLTFVPTPGLIIPGLNTASITSLTGTAGESVITVDALFGSDKVDLSLYAGGSSFIASSSLFGETNYGFGAEDLEGIIALLSGMFGETLPVVDGETEAGAESNIAAIIETLKSLLEGKNGEKLASFAEKYLNVIAESVNNASKNKVTVGDEIKVTIEFNTDSAKKAIKDVFNTIKKDTEFKSFIADLLGALGMDKTLASAQINAILSDDTLTAIFEAIESMPFSFTMEVKADKNYIFKAFTLGINMDGEKIGFFFDMSDKNKIEIGIKSEYSDDELGAFSMEEKIVIETKTENGTTTVDMSLVSAYGNEKQVVKIFSVATKENGDYALTVHFSDLGSEYAAVTLEGNITEEENVTTATLTKVSYGTESLAVNLTLTVETGITLPKFPTEYKNVLEITDDDITAIMAALIESPLGQFIPQEEEPDVDPDLGDDILGDDILGDDTLEDPDLGGEEL